LGAERRRVSVVFQWLGRLHSSHAPSIPPASGKFSELNEALSTNMKLPAPAAHSPLKADPYAFAPSFACTNSVVACLITINGTTLTGSRTAAKNWLNQQFHPTKFISPLAPRPEDHDHGLGYHELGDQLIPTSKIGYTH
jgi:hypothetical protein